MAEVEVLVSNSPVTVDLGSAVIDGSGGLEITAQATSLTALNIALYARFALFVAANPTANELLVRYEVTDQLQFAANLALSRGSAVSGATGSSVFSLQKNGVEFGTATFGAGSSTAIFAGSATTFNAGDILTVYAPSSQDATLANVSLTLAATRIV